MNKTYTELEAKAIAEGILSAYCVGFMSKIRNIFDALDDEAETRDWMLLCAHYTSDCKTMIGNEARAIINAHFANPGEGKSIIKAAEQFVGYFDEMNELMRNEK